MCLCGIGACVCAVYGCMCMYIVWVHVFLQYVGVRDLNLGPFVC